MQIGHAQFFFFGLDLAFVPDVGLGEFVLEEAFVVVPGLLGGAFGEPREIVGIGDGFAASALRGFGEQSEIEALDRLAAFRG